jgi:hypothetical protein
MYIPHGIGFREMDAIQKRKRKLTKEIFLKLKRIFKKLKNKN